MAETKTKSNEEVLGDNPLFKMGPPLIQTYEDAQVAFLREQISEEELRAAAGKFGRVDHTYNGPPSLERPDEAFHRSFPEDLQVSPEYERLEVEQRLEQADAKQQVRDAATEASEKVTQKLEPEVSLEIAKNEAAEKAAEKKEDQLEAKLYPRTEDKDNAKK